MNRVSTQQGAGEAVDRGQRADAERVREQAVGAERGDEQVGADVGRDHQRQRAERRPQAPRRAGRCARSARRSARAIAIEARGDRGREPDACGPGPPAVRESKAVSSAGAEVAERRRSPGRRPAAAPRRRRRGRRRSSGGRRRARPRSAAGGGAPPRRSAARRRSLHQSAPVSCISSIVAWVSAMSERSPVGTGISRERDLERRVGLRVDRDRILLRGRGEELLALVGEQRADEVERLLLALERLEHADAGQQQQRAEAPRAGSRRSTG